MQYSEGEKIDKYLATEIPNILLMGASGIVAIEEDGLQVFTDTNINAIVLCPYSPGTKIKGYSMAVFSAETGPNLTVQLKRLAHGSTAQTLEDVGLPLTMETQEYNRYQVITSSYNTPIVIESGYDYYYSLYFQSNGKEYSFYNFGVHTEKRIL